MGKCDRTNPQNCNALKKKASPFCKVHIFSSQTVYRQSDKKNTVLTE